MEGMEGRESGISPLRSFLSPPSFLVIGHLVRDLVPGGYRPGGTALYAAVTAHRLGERVAVVTSAGPDLHWAPLLAGVDVLCYPSPATTTFENRYTSRGRVQFLRAVASPLSLSHVPAPWRRAPTVLLAPVAQEVDPHLAHAFPGALLAATAQGWLRIWNGSGRVRPAPWETGAEVLPHLGALIVSEEDVGGDWGLLEDYARQTRVLAVTQGAQGATVFAGGQRRSFPAYPAVEVDPTGAGDVFAAAFLVELSHTADPFAAARFANAAASCSVEHLGVEGVPTAEQVRRRLESQ